MHACMHGMHVSHTQSLTGYGLIVIDSRFRCHFSMFKSREPYSELWRWQLRKMMISKDGELMISKLVLTRSGTLQSTITSTMQCIAHCADIG